MTGGRPGCLVLDVRLRGGGGLDLQDELRRRKATLPIIDFLQKPVPPTGLARALGRFDTPVKLRTGTT
jgi:hypothetical protein